MNKDATENAQDGSEDVADRRKWTAYISPKTTAEVGGNPYSTAHQDYFFFTSF